MLGAHIAMAQLTGSLSCILNCVLGQLSKFCVASDILFPLAFPSRLSALSSLYYPSMTALIGAKSGEVLKKLSPKCPGIILRAKFIIDF